MKIKIFLALMFSALLSFAQQKDDIIFQAMEDEMQRSMDSLTFNDHPRPFFIAYMLFDTDYLTITSDIGGIASSDKDFNRSWSIRLMIGDYALNDENFMSYDHSAPSMSSMWGSPNFPIDLDYRGMRKSWWLITDNIYRRAVNSYENKIKTIKENGLEDHELLFDDYSKEDVVELIVNRDKLVIDKEKLEKKASNLSAACLDLPEISYSTVEMNVNMSDAYQLNSEGTRYKVPLDLTSLSLRLSLEDEDKKAYSASMKVLCENPEHLPDNDLIMKDAGIIASFLKEISQAPAMEDEYTGPVLFEGEIASHMLCSSLIGINLMAERQSLNSSFNNVYFESLDNIFQKKWNKKVLPENINISVHPRTKNFEGTTLLGASLIDYEGVVPPENIMLVENGILKGMLATRIPTTVTKNSNGHYRIYPSSYTVFSNTGPGVIKYSVNESLPEEQLRSTFLEYAAEAGLEYAYIIRSLPGNSALMPIGVYKLNIETNEEVLVKKASFNDLLEIKAYKDIVAYGNKLTAGNYKDYSSRSFQAQYSEVGMFDYYYYNEMGSLVSIIAPNSFIIDDFTISANNQIDKLDKQEDYLPNPIRAYKDK